MRLSPTLAFLLTTALGGPLAGRAQEAQEAPATPLPRYYVGVAAYSSAYQPLSGGYQGTRLPFQLTAGYQLRPRLALQLGVAYSGVSSSYFNASQYFPNPGGPGVYIDYNLHSTERNTSLALLARYTLTRQATHRLQVDLLGGLTVEAGHYTYHNLTTDSSQVPVTRRYDQSGTDWSYLLTVGPSVRYRLGRHLEALLDFTLNHDFDSDHRPHSSVLTGATALGLRYRFGELR